MSTSPPVIISLADLTYDDHAGIGAARATVVAAARARDVSRQQAEDAVLVLSELMANALHHTDTGAPRARVDLIDDEFEVIVTDTDSTAPTPQPADAVRVGGNGMRIVEAIASRWGTHVHDGLGKSVWCRLPATS